MQHIRTVLEILNATHPARTVVRVITVWACKHCKATSKNDRIWHTRGRNVAFCFRRSPRPIVLWKYVLYTGACVGIITLRPGYFSTLQVLNKLDHISHIIRSWTYACSTDLSSIYVCECWTIVVHSVISLQIIKNEPKVFQFNESERLAEIWVRSIWGYV